MANRLKGKVAIVTGAGSGIGRAAAILFAKEGAKVVVADYDEKGGRETAAMISRAKGKAIFVKADVSSSSDAKKLVAAAVKNFGKLNILYNNAGIVRWGNAVECTEEDWNRVIDINMKGAWLCSKYAIPEMTKAGGGSIINTASIAGCVAFAKIAAYCASKGGLIELTKSMALDFAQNKIRVNAICPGVIKTGMTKGILNDKKTLQGMLKATVIGRLGEPEDIAYAALYLASDESSFVTGTTIVADGGWTVQ
ncbi:glucose 1-dehydrogenase [Candidatus Woesearchaeota archaeon]|nr:glucose 1-dehydrogenase [Candidatus Woesearchaeota archaeon]